VTIALRREDDAHLRFSVADTGIGIPESALPRVFDAFVQVDGSTARRHEGTGVGLAIVRRLVTLMGGDVGVTSEPGRGSEFWFTVATGEAAAAAAPERSAQPAVSVGTRLAEGGPADAAPLVLVADDNEVNQRVAVRVLQKLGCRVDVAANGREALTAAARGGYVLVLMDCQMPEVDGFAATRAIRALPDQRRRVPIVALTAGTQAGLREQGVASGMDAFLNKPVRIDDLRAILDRLGAARGATESPAAQTGR
jgi:CheY-like chemotaxis protein